MSPAENNLVSILIHKSQSAADRVAYRFIEDEHEPVQELTYYTLHQQALAIAATLRSHCRKGDRVLMMYQSSREFIPAFFGCLYAGVIAVPAYPPRKNHNAVRLLSIIEDAGVNAVLSTVQIHHQIHSLVEYRPLFEQAAWINSDEVKNNSVSFTPETVAGEEVMFLQYTSGSTGKPKGVIVTHDNIWANLGMLYEALEVNEETVYVSWLPYFHDMGLIGVILEAMYAGVPAVMMNPAYFLQKPIRWLQAISKYGGTISGAPNFAYDLCVDKIRAEDLDGIDLSSWKVAFNGAEPVSAKTIGRFYNRFKNYGFTQRTMLPSFGLAEATLFVSAQLNDAGPTVLSLDQSALQHGQVLVNTPDVCVDMVSCGKTWHDHEIVVVDPVTQKSCEDGVVGELWFKGKSVAGGYWNKPEESKAVFEAFTTEGDGPYLRTGDLAFMHDGEIYITGRLKDVLVIRGANYYPQDLEQATWESHTDLSSNNTAAFTIDTEAGTQLVIVQEVQRTAVRNLQTSQLFEAIIANIASQYQLQVFDIMLLSPGNILKTSSGKIQRQANKQAYLNNEFNSLAQWRREDDAVLAETENQMPGNRKLEIWMQQKIAELVNLSASRVSIDKDFSSYGLDSMGAVQLSGALEAYLGVSVPPGLVYDYPSIAQLAEYLLSNDQAAIKHQTFVHADDNDVAIIGMSGRFPGAKDLQEFERILFNAENSITTPGIDAPTDGNTRKVTYRSGYIPGVDLFDANFFEIAPKEAKSVDPQQRLMLELCYTAMQDAGYPAQKLKGSATGVFVGVSNFDYAQLSLKHAQHKSAYFGTGVALSIAANRVSYFFDFKGPSLCIDTACSSSLVAVHQAVRSIRAGESTMALAGGVNLILSDTVNEYLDAGKLLASDGHCKTFDAAADGYVRGEGAGVLLLKSKKQAILDGDTIYAVIKGSAIVQDGHSNGLLAPNGVSQQQVLRNALTDAQVASYSIVYVEAHGTGTALGDPIEVSALDNVFGSERSAPLLVGSVKANIGHLESAAGIAGLIKTVICLRRKQVPQQVHFKTHNPNISWNKLCVQIPTTVSALNGNGQLLRTGVSSFGFGGTNAHVVLEEYQTDDSVNNDIESTLPYSLLAFSGKSAEALTAQASSLLDFLENAPDIKIEDLAYSLANTRDHFAHRMVLKCKSIDELFVSLKEMKRGNEDSVSIVRGMSGQQSGRTAFLFTGGGAQYAGMADSAYTNQPVFKAAIDKCIDLANIWLKIGLREILFAAPDSDFEKLLHRIDYMQPALFAYEYAMAQLWMSWGVMPNVLIGHSLGEIVAACIAGVFSLEDGMKLVCARGRLMQGLPAGGVMISLQANEAEVVKAIGNDSGKVSIAVINGPDQTVIAGEKDAAEKIKKIFDEKGVKTKLLQVSHASHSVLMDPILDQYAEVLAGIQFHKPRYTLISNTTGKAADETICTPQYWVNHLRNTVRFSSGIEQLETSDVRMFIEVGPQPVLLGIAKECIESEDICWLPSARNTDPTVLYDSLIRFYTAGGTVNWSAFYNDLPGKKIALPTYSFQRESYWIDTPVTVSSQDGLATGMILLGAKIDVAGEIEVYETIVDLRRFPYLTDHKVMGKVLVPASFFCDVVQSYIASKGIADGIVEEILFEKPLIVEADTTIRLQLIVKKEPNAQAEFTINYRSIETSDESWNLIARGAITQKTAGDFVSKTFGEVRKQFVQTLSVADLYEDYASRGMEYGASFQSVTEISRNGNSVLGKIKLNHNEAEGESAEYELHPVLLDGSFQLLNALVAESTQAYLPFSVEGYRFSGKTNGVVWAVLHLQDNDQSKNTLTASIELWNEQGEPIGSIECLSVKKASATFFENKARSDFQYHLEWKPVALELKAGLSLTNEKWLVIAPESSTTLATSLINIVKERGATVIVTHDFRAIPDVAPNKIICFWPNAGADDMAAVAAQNALTGLAQLQSFLSAADRVDGFWWITNGANQITSEVNVDLSVSPLWGLGRVFMREHETVNFKLLDIVNVDEVTLLADLINASPEENELAIDQSQIYALRLLPGLNTAREQINGNRQLVFSEGGFDSLSYELVPEKGLRENEVQIRVKYAGLNFRDVFRVLGLIAHDKGELGGECSGIVVKVGAAVKGLQPGDQVMALAEGTFATTVVTDHRLVIKKPANIDLREAATIPIAFLTAWYGLKYLADVQPGERALIHSAAGGVGMAAVQIVHYSGGVVYGTASQSKWSDVSKLTVSHVYDSRTLDFKEQILADTKGKGVNIVLNSFIEKFVDHSLDLLSEGGRFLEIGKRDIREPQKIAGEHPGVFYAAYDLIYLMQHQQDLIQEMFTNLRPLFENNTLRPLPYTAFDVRDAREAFQFMSKAKQVGKIVLSISENEDIRSVQLTQQSTALLTGGLGGLGVELANYLVKKYEIKHLLLIGRKAPTQEIQQRLDMLERAGTRVTVASVDVTDPVALGEIIASIPEEYPLKAVFHLAGMLDDAMITELDDARFSNVMAPKIQGAWNLHELTKDLNLDFFVLFSSAAAILGSAGQSNYAAANAFLDSLTFYRSELGLPACAISWGPWEAAGLVHRMGEEHKKRIRKQGVGLMSNEEGIALLDHALESGVLQPVLLPVLKNRLTELQQSSRALCPSVLKDLLVAKRPDAEKKSPDVWIKHLMSLGRQQRQPFLIETLQQEIARILSVSDAKKIHLEKSLQEFGMDSLMAVELRNKLSALIGKKLPVSLLFDYPNVLALAGFLNDQIGQQQAIPDTGVVSTQSEWREIVYKQLLGELKQKGGPENQDYHLAAQKMLDDLSQMIDNAVKKRSSSDTENLDNLSLEELENELENELRNI